jgi:hypothetical protein
VFIMTEPVICIESEETSKSNQDRSPATSEECPGLEGMAFPAPYNGDGNLA